MGRLTWRPATVVDTMRETPAVKTLAIEAPGWPGHRPGQHVDLRLTAQDGYQAVRSYSLAAPSADGRVTVTVERLPDGEVSPYLVDEARPGDRLELRGPVGGYFVWEPALGGPLLLVGGGSGIVPLAAMLRARDADRGPAVPTRLLYSVRSREDAIFAGELDRLEAGDPQLEIVYTFTRTPPPAWSGHRRRVDRAMLGEVEWPAAERPLTFVCGPTAFVETAAQALTELGHDSERIRTERFGPTGGDPR